jgi:hypothetical protein
MLKAQVNETSNDVVLVFLHTHHWIAFTFHFGTFSTSKSVSLHIFWRFGDKFFDVLLLPLPIQSKM